MTPTGRKSEIEQLLSRPTISVPECGMKIFGLSKNGSYEAAARGEIPTISFGKKKVVPCAKVRRMIGLED